MGVGIRTVVASWYVARGKAYTDLPEGKRVLGECSFFLLVKGKDFPTSSKNLCHSQLSIRRRTRFSSAPVKHVLLHVTMADVFTGLKDVWCG